MPSLLVVDDTPIIRTTIAQVIARDTNLSPVLQAANGAEAIAMARRHRPDIILMDIKMPGIDGLQASATIRAEQPKARIIILSTHDDFASVQRALKLGAIDYLLKPVRPTKLIDLLAQVCADLLAEHLPPEIINSDEQGGGAPPPHEASSLLSADLIQQALDYIRQNHQRPDISLGDVADAVHISPSHLSHLLKARAGVSYKQQLTSLRIEAAKRLLQSTNLSVNAIGERVGYHNATNFYRLFNRETGMTPSEFRRQAGEA